MSPAEMIVIGASAGAVDALSLVFKPLPAEFALPILVVVHLPPNRRCAIAEVLAGKCAVRVCEPDDKEPIVPGTIYFAPPDYHLLAERGSIALSSEEPVHFSRPAIDVLFESAADVYGAAAVGVILTGANQDGARGLRAIVDAGGTAIVQRPETAAASTMPQAALELCPQARSLQLDEIGQFLKDLSRGT